MSKTALGKNYLFQSVTILYVLILDRVSLNTYFFVLCHSDITLTYRHGKLCFSLVIITLSAASHSYYQANYFYTSIIMFNNVGGIALRSCWFIRRHSSSNCKQLNGTEVSKYIEKIRIKTRFKCWQSMTKYIMTNYNISSVNFLK